MSYSHTKRRKLITKLKRCYGPINFYTNFRKIAEAFCMIREAKRSTEICKEQGIKSTHPETGTIYDIVPKQVDASIELNEAIKATQEESKFD